MAQLSVIGDTFYDIVATDLAGLPCLGADVLGTISTYPGGSAVNIVSHAATYSSFIELPTRIAIYSAVGSTDEFGRLIIEHLKRLGIETFMKMSDKPTAKCLVLSTASDRSFVSDRGSIIDIDLRQFDPHTFMEQVKNGHLHLAGVYLSP